MTFEVFTDDKPELWDSTLDIDCDIINTLKEMILDYETNYIRLGECKRCGLCCYVFNRELKLVPCKHLSYDDNNLAVCALYGQKNRPERCINFPQKDHLYKYPNCGYTWKLKQ